MVVELWGLHPVDRWPGQDRAEDQWTLVRRISGDDHTVEVLSQAAGSVLGLQWELVRAMPAGAEPTAIESALWQVESGILGKRYTVEERERLRRRGET